MPVLSLFLKNSSPLSLRYTTTTTVHPGFLQILRSLFLSLNGSETDLLFNLPWVTVVALLILNLQLLPNENKNLL